MKLTFTHAGQQRTLAKHPKVQQALKLGTMTEEQAKHAPWYLRLSVAGIKRKFKLPAAEKDAIERCVELTF